LPGPTLMMERPDIFWGLTISMLVGNFILLMLNVPLVRLWTKILSIPYTLLYPFILFVCAVGAYTMRNSIEDILFVAFFGTLGYMVMMFKVNPVPFMLGFVLGPKLEVVFRRTLIISEGNFWVFLERPISLFLLLCTASFLFVGFRNMKKKDA